MDTISRESSSSSYLPVAGVLIGVLALILGGFALAKVSSLNKRVPEDLPDKMAGIETDTRNAAAAADKAGKDVVLLTRSTQSALDAIGPEIGALKDSVKKLEDSAKARASARQAKAADAASKPGEAAAAGPGEYEVKPGDTGMKIAKELGVPFHDLETANPGIDWNRLKPGQKIKTK
jgi:LysM repeat protein